MPNFMAFTPGSRRRYAAAPVVSTGPPDGAALGPEPSGRACGAWWVSLIDVDEVGCCRDVCVGFTVSFGWYSGDAPGSGPVRKPARVGSGVGADRTREGAVPVRSEGFVQTGIRYNDSCLRLCPGRG